MSDGLYLGLDIGTSGVRTAVVDAAGQVVGDAAVAFADPAGRDAREWLRTAYRCLERQCAALPSVSSVRGIAVDGTSGSVVLLDESGEPATPGLLYDAKGFRDAAARIASVAPEGSIARGEGSALARVLHLQSLAPGARHLAHQADYVAGALLGRWGVSDESNALKTGYDPVARLWPDWIGRTGLRTDLLSHVHPVGTVVGRIAPEASERFGLSPDAAVVAGATDSVAAFLAAGATERGTAVTSLGTTLALKVLSDAPVTDAARGVYSHRVGNDWLPGGASNVGGGVLLQHFSPDELDAVSERIDPDWTPQHLDAYPLPRPGERFPRNDPDLLPNLPPREDDARFLFELLHAAARVEREGYEALRSLGAPYPVRVLTAGGGARNKVWTAIRERVLGVPVAPAPHGEAAVGMALLARRALLPSAT